MLPHHNPENKVAHRLAFKFEQPTFKTSKLTDIKPLP